MIRILSACSLLCLIVPDELYLEGFNGLLKLQIAHWLTLVMLYLGGPVSNLLLAESVTQNSLAQQAQCVNTTLASGYAAATGVRLLFRGQSGGRTARCQSRISWGGAATICRIKFLQSILLVASGNLLLLLLVLVRFVIKHLDVLLSGKVLDYRYCSTRSN